MGTISWEAEIERTVRDSESRLEKIEQRLSLHGALHDKQAVSIRQAKALHDLDWKETKKLQSRVTDLEQLRVFNVEQEVALKSQAAQQQAQPEPTITHLKGHAGIQEAQSAQTQAFREWSKDEPAQSYGRIQQQALSNVQAAPGQMQDKLYAPLRSDTKPLIDLAAFARRLLNPDDLGHAVTKEVRDSARRALGTLEVREYDL